MVIPIDCICVTYQGNGKNHKIRREEKPKKMKIFCDFPWISNFPDGPYNPEEEGVLPTVIVSLGKGAPISNSLEELGRQGLNGVIFIPVKKPTM